MRELADLPMIVRSIAQGAFVRVNHSFLATVGLSGEELGTKPFVDWLVPEDRESFQLALESGDGRCRVRHHTKDGESLELDLLVRGQGENAHVLGRQATPCAATSASDEVQAEADDVTVKGTLHTIAKIIEEQNPGYKCSILLVAHGRFVSGAGPSLPDDYNNAIDGYAVGPTVGSCGTAIYWGVPVIVADIQKDPLWAPFAELAKNAGVAACWSHPFATKGGKVLGALAFYSPEPRAPTAEQLSRLRAAAQLTGLAVERGRAEEELRSANAVKSRFMANMSHEIRTPLNALIGITDSLRGVSGMEHHEEIRDLREASEHLLELFTGVLEMTEVQDRSGLDTVIDLPACCRRIQEPCAEAAEAKGLQFEMSISNSVPQWARLDEWAFERALKLLLQNAVKFTNQGRVEVAVDFEDFKLSVRIADTGCGIDLGRLNELRAPFVQGDLSTTKRYSGFGLGLAVSDLCLHALGGKLKFATNEPQGTVVSFRIPVTPAPPAETAAVHPPKARTSADLPVLVVEDNALNSKVIGSILRRAGYRCEYSENGSEAVEASEQNSYCCILMDCQMPVMDGYEATRRIREREGSTGDHVPIIAVTANALAGDRDLCLDAGMDDYLKKPVRQGELMHALEEYVDPPSGEA